MVALLPLTLLKCTTTSRSAVCHQQMLSHLRANPNDAVPPSAILIQSLVFSLAVSCLISNFAQLLLSLRAEQVLILCGRTCKHLACVAVRLKLRLCCCSPHVGSAVVLFALAEPTACKPSCTVLHAICGHRTLSAGAPGGIHMSPRAPAHNP